MFLKKINSLEKFETFVALPTILIVNVITTFVIYPSFRYNSDQGNYQLSSIVSVIILWGTRVLSVPIYLLIINIIYGIKRGKWIRLILYLISLFIIITGFSTLSYVLSICKGGCEINSSPLLLLGSYYSYASFLGLIYPFVHFLVAIAAVIKKRDNN